MIKVVKGNVVLKVEYELMDFYVNKGYTAKTLDGKILKEAIPSDMPSLRKAYLDGVKKIKALEEKVESLNGEISTLKGQLDRTQQPIVSEDKPKRTRRKSSEEE